MKLDPRCGWQYALVLSLLTLSVATAQDDDTAGIPSVVQLPTFGVAIDSEGVLELKTFTDPGGRLRAARVAAARTALPNELLRPSKLRKISLRRLAESIHASIEKGEPLSDDIKCLAGLQRIQYVFTYEVASDSPGDIVIAGPADGWITDTSGRVVGATTGQPVVLLEDLAVALRAFPPTLRERPFLGCTIDPTADGLAQLVAFQKTIPRSIATAARQSVAMNILEGTRESLGMAEIRTFGVSAQTHFAQVLIEADYRMKRIAIGAEPPPVRMTTFVSALDSPRQAMLQRWWFTPDYDCVRATEDRLSMELIGEVVKLQAEDIRIGADGTLTDSRKPSRPSQLYCDAFTRKYPEIAAASPVYAQLRTMIDLAIVAAYLQKYELYSRADVSLDIFRDEGALPCEVLAEPKRVPCVATVFWKRNRLICPAGGGVSIDAFAALDDDHLQTAKDGKLDQLRHDTRVLMRPVRWWWD